MILSPNGYVLLYRFIANIFVNGYIILIKHLIAYVSVQGWIITWFFINIQRDPKTGELEGLSFDFNLCEAVATWERVSSVAPV